MTSTDLHRSARRELAAVEERAWLDGVQHGIELAIALLEQHGEQAAADLLRTARLCTTVDGEPRPLDP